MQLYQMPDLGAKVADLVPDNASGNRLDPETPVACINRGQKPLHDKWDGRDYTIPPGLFRARYDQALHFKARSVVPGSRNPETGKQTSYIGIIGVDKDENCFPFTADECERFNAAVEAIDREALTDSRARMVTVVQTAAARARMPGAGAAAGGLKLQHSIEAGDPNSPQAQANAETVLQPDTTAQRQMASDLAGAAAEDPAVYAEAVGAQGTDPVAPRQPQRRQR